MLVTSIFFFFPQFFYSIKERNLYFSNIEFVFCKCFQIGHVQNLSFGKRLKLVPRRLCIRLADGIDPRADCVFGAVMDPVFKASEGVNPLPHNPSF